VLGFDFLTSHGQKRPRHLPNLHRTWAGAHFCSERWAFYSQEERLAIARKLFRIATFSYDGTQYKGANVQAITPNDRFYCVTKT